MPVRYSSPRVNCERENYLCPDLIEEMTGVAVTFTDTCYAKKIIGRAVGMKPDNVLDKFWPRMTAGKNHLKINLS